jgi:hypothetical protein
MNFYTTTELLILVYKIISSILDLIKSNSVAGSKPSETLAELTGRIGSDLELIIKDQRVDYKDIGQIVKLIRDMSGLMGLDYNKAKDEIMTGTREDLDLVIQGFKKEFDIQDDLKEVSIEVIFENILIITNSSKKLIDEFKKLNV